MLRVLNAVSALMAIGSSSVLELKTTFVDKHNRQWRSPAYIHSKRTNKYANISNGTREVSRRQRQIAAGTLQTTNQIRYNAMLRKIDQSSPVQAG